MIRDKPIYISTEVSRMLWILSKAEKSVVRGDMAEVQRTRTPDEIADTMLRQSIREQYPQLAEHLSRIDKLEREIIKTIQSK